MEEAYFRAGLITMSFRSKVRPRTFECVAMGSAVLFIWRSRLLLYSAGSAMNREQFVLSGFSVLLYYIYLYSYRKYTF